MSTSSWTTFLLIGLISGWFVYLRRRTGFPQFLFSPLTGIFGAFLGGMIFGTINVAAINVIGEFAASFAGAVFVFESLRFARKSFKFIKRKSLSENREKFND